MLSTVFLSENLRIHLYQAWVIYLTALISGET
jgi:hypothetical protein